MKKNNIIISGILLSLFTILQFTSCGSKPKREMKITLIYSNANEMLESANASILSGDYETAEYFLNLGYSQAMTIDNYDLLTSICLAYVSLNLSYNPPATDNAKFWLNKARTFANYSVAAEKQNAMCLLSEIRIDITTSEASTNYEQLLKNLKDNEKYVKADPYSLAQYCSAYGDIYKVQSNYKDAEDSYKEAAELYTKNCYLSEIGITWYKIAQVRSLNNKKAAALDALNKAIFYDREAENTLALGTDYYVRGVILLKGTPTPEEKAEAKFSFEHSADIFTAAGIGMESLAIKSLAAANEL